MRRDALKLQFGKGIVVRLFDARTGKLLRTTITNNLVLDLAQATLLQMPFADAGSVRKISKIAIGQGTTAPTAEDTNLQTFVLAKSGLTVDQTGESSIPASRILSVIFNSSEANGAGTTYIRELGLRFDNDGPVTRALFKQGTITGASQTDPVVIDSVAHGLVNGDQIFIEGVGGMTEINSGHFTVANKTDDDFELEGEDGTGHTAYTTGGKWTLEFEKNSSKVLEVSYPVAFVTV